MGFARFSALLAGLGLIGSRANAIAGRSTSPDPTGWVNLTANTGAVNNAKCRRRATRKRTKRGNPPGGPAVDDEAYAEKN
jgi:hypothetical protein